MHSNDVIPEEEKYVLWDLMIPHLNDVYDETSQVFDTLISYQDLINQQDINPAIAFFFLLNYLNHFPGSLGKYINRLEDLWFSIPETRQQSIHSISSSYTMESILHSIIGHAIYHIDPNIPRLYQLIQSMSQCCFGIFTQEIDRHKNYSRLSRCVLNDMQHFDDELFVYITAELTTSIQIPLYEQAVATGADFKKVFDKVMVMWNKNEVNIFDPSRFYAMEYAESIYDRLSKAGKIQAVQVIGNQEFLKQIVETTDNHELIDAAFRNIHDREFYRQHTDITGRYYLENILEFFDDKELVELLIVSPQLTNFDDRDHFNLLLKQIYTIEALELLSLHVSADHSNMIKFRMEQLEP